MGGYLGAFGPRGRGSWSVCAADPAESFAEAVMRPRPGEILVLETVALTKVRWSIYHVVTFFIDSFFID